MEQPPYDRRKEDQHLLALERRVSDLEGALRYDVVRKSGPWITRFERLEDTVRDTAADFATKREIEEALRHQTKTLKATKESHFTRREKIIGLIFAGLIVAADIFHIFTG